MEFEFSPRAVYSLAIAAGHMVGAVVLTLVLGRVKRLPTVDWLVLLWLCYDVIVHVTLEGPFVYYSIVGTIQETNGVIANVWKEYALADSRWGISDPTVVSLEIITVVVDSILCLVVIYTMLCNKSSRHFWQVILCVCELYGGWMTFCPEWLVGSPSLNTENPLHLWVYLIFFNGVWVVIPLLLLVQSWAAITAPSYTQYIQTKKKR